jgi:hypothetical protein
LPSAILFSCFLVSATTGDLRAIGGFLLDLWKL